MADLIDILKGKNPQAQDNDGEDLDFIAVQPKITDDTFYSDILEELDAAEIIDFSYINAHQFNFVGSTDGDEDVLGLENGTASFDFEEYKNIFIGYKGSIGRFGSTAIFPFVIDYPDNYKKLIPLIDEIDNLYCKLIPGKYKLQKKES